MTLKQTLFLLAFLASTLSAFSQEDTVFIKQTKDWTADTLVYVTDTVVFSSGMVRHILTGTTVLPWTHNQQGAKGNGLYLDKVTKSDCQSNGEEPYRSADKINSVVVTDTSITVDINIYDNCCYDFLCDMYVDSSETLNLIYQGYGTYCACDCCFGLTYHIRRVLPDYYPAVEAVTLSGKEETLRKIKKN